MPATGAAGRAAGAAGRPQHLIVHPRLWFRGGCRRETASGAASTTVFKRILLTSLRAALTFEEWRSTPVYLFALGMGSEPGPRREACRLRVSLSVAGSKPKRSTASRSST